MCMPRPLAVLEIVCLPLLLGAWGSVSGIYIANFSNGVGMLQIVETPDHRISGHYETTAVDKDGGLFERKSVVSGAVDGGNLSLKFDFLQSAAATIDGNVITILGLEANPVVLRQGDLQSYQKRAMAIKSEVDFKQLTAKIEAGRRKFADDVAGVLVSMGKMVNASDRLVPKLAETEGRYRKITAAMAEFVEQQWQLAPIQTVQARTARIQLGSGIIQQDSAREQIHNKALQLVSQIEGVAKPVHKKTDAIEPKCKLRTDLADCAKFAQLLPSYREKYDRLVAALQSEEAAYRDEKARQDTLEAASNRIQ